MADVVEVAPIAGIIQAQAGSRGSVAGINGRMHTLAAALVALVIACGITVAALIATACHRNTQVRLGSSTEA